MTYFIANCNNVNSIDGNPFFWLINLFYSKGESYCSDRCASTHDEPDHVLDYTRALMSEGLDHIARKDAVREGDGPAMISDGKMDSVQFWNRRNNKYAILAHNLLACT